MGAMPGHGGFPPDVVAQMIEAAKTRGKCAAVSTQGWVCTENADHPTKMHRATDTFGNVQDTWVEAPGAWTPEDARVSPTAKRLRDQAQRADHIAGSFRALVRSFEENPQQDFVDAWEAVERLIMAMPGAMTPPAIFDLLAYFIARACWSDPDTIPKEQ